MRRLLLLIAASSGLALGLGSSQPASAVRIVYPGPVEDLYTVIGGRPCVGEEPNAICGPIQDPCIRGVYCGDGEG